MCYQLHQPPMLGDALYVIMLIQMAHLYAKCVNIQQHQQREEHMQNSLVISKYMVYTKS